MRPSPKVKNENRRASTISILFPAGIVQRYNYFCGIMSHHACVRLNGGMYITPVRQKWANQVAELTGKKAVKVGLLHIDLFQVISSVFGGQQEKWGQLDLDERSLWHVGTSSIDYSHC